MRFFGLEDILLLHFKIIEDFGGSHGVRAEDRLESVVEAPRQEAFGVPLYPSVYEKSAAYLRGIVMDHPFVDGNKRTGVTVAVIFVQRAGYVFTATPKELEDFAVQVAVERLVIPTIAAWLRAHSAKA